MLFSLGSLKRRVCTWSSGCPGAANIASRCMSFELRASALMCFFNLSMKCVQQRPFCRFLLGIETQLDIQEKVWSKKSPQTRIFRGSFHFLVTIVTIAYQIRSRIQGTSKICVYTTQEPPYHLQGLADIRHDVDFKYFFYDVICLFL